MSCVLINKVSFINFTVIECGNQDNLKTYYGANKLIHITARKRVLLRWCSKEQDIKSKRRRNQETYTNMAFSWSVQRQELSCPVCHDYYKDPVLLPCSHSFCNDCVESWWATTRTRHCPFCKTLLATNAPPTRNLVLKNLCEAFLLEMNSGVVCPQHTEKLKLYCLDHREPVCVVCRDSSDHKDHSFTPVDEAAETYRRSLRESLKPLTEKVKLYNKSKAQLEQVEQDIKDQVQDTEEKIRGIFRTLQAFLSKEEGQRIAVLRREQTRRINGVKSKIAALSEELSDMESTIETLEGGLKDDDTSFLLKVDALTEAVQRPLPGDPEQVTVSLIDVAKYVGNLSFTTWCKMKEIVSFTPIVLNPNTAHRELHLDDSLTSVSCGPKQPPSAVARSQLERLEQHRSVLGSQGFTSGIHSWEVETGDNQVWALGVMAQKAKSKGDLLSGLWMVRFCHGKYTAFCPSRPMLLLPLRGNLPRVRVHLDCDKGKLSLSDPLTNENIHTFTHKFKDKMFPYFNTWSDAPLKIRPFVVSVTTE